MRDTRLPPYRPKKVRLLLDSSLAALTLTLTGPARAADECGAPSGSPPTVSCTTAGNPYPGGINYSADTAGLTLNIDSGVVITSNVAGSLSAISANGNGNTAPIVINAPNVNIDLSNDPTASNRKGIVASGLAGDATVTAGGTINIVGANDVVGILAQTSGAGPAQASITYNGPSSGPGITIQGANSAGIEAFTAGTGSATITASGNITASVGPAGAFAAGLYAPTLAGNSVIHYKSGTVDVSGPLAYGITAASYAGGSARVTTDPGTSIIMTGAPLANPQAAVILLADGTTAASGEEIRGDIASRIQTSGLATPDADFSHNPIGIDAETDLDAPINLNYTGPGITTSGGGGAGILALSGSGAVTINSSGSITTNGTLAPGIFADSGEIARSSAPSLSGAPRILVRGATVAASGVGGAVSVTASGTITTQGSESPGIWANSATRDVHVEAKNVSTTGQFSTGIKASGGGAVAVIVDAGGTVSGGWQPDVSSVGAISGLPAAGVILASTGGSATLSNNGSIGALSDRAISGNGGTVTVTNTGTITGYATLGAGQNTIDNRGTWNLRHFADTDGDGTRDTLRVATLDMGSAATGSFTNTGTLALQGAPATGRLDSTGQYLPLGNPNNAMAPGGPAQGALLGVGASTFTNSGTIDLQANTAAGDVLLISSTHTSGTVGAGTFASNGGTLKVDTVLNEGGAASRSDVLVVDGTKVGAGGATRIQVRNVGGAGAPTPGDGVPLVVVLDPSRSAAGAFALDGRAVAGAYEYQLKQGGVQNPADGNWYLRSEFTPTTPQPGPIQPLYRPEIAAYLANQRLAGVMFLHSLHDRLGEPQFTEARHDAAPAAQHPSAWLRLVGRTGDTHSKDGNFDADTDTLLLQGGGELAQWALASADDRLHLGAMAGYGRADSRASAFSNPAHAKGEVDGYSVGAYTTWYANEPNRLGAYVDSWLLYGWFDAQVKGDQLPEIGYDARGWTASLEAGYALPLAATGWVIEPQVQLTYIGYREDDVDEPNGTHVDGADASGVASRLGVRTHQTFARPDGSRVQPYVTVNWWHDRVDNSISFNQLPLGTLYPENRYELKIGLNGDIGQGWSGWANVSGEWGSQNYEQYAGRIGAKYTW